MSLPSDTELLPPSGAVTRLPALGSPELSTDYLARIKEILEALLGRRGGNGWDRVVTFRDLHEMGMQGGANGGGMVFNMAGAETVDTSAPGFQQFVGRLSDEIMRSTAFKTLKARIGSAEDLAHLPEEIKRQLQLRLEQVARERQADIQTVEAKIQTNALSMASRLTEITAALDQYAAGVRQFDTAYADRTQSIALQVTQLAASLEGVGSVELEERFQAIASAIDGLKGQWSVKVQTNDPDNPVIAGIALAVEDPIAGPGTSSLIFMAEKFGFVTENGTAIPFVIVGDQIEFNGNVRINGNLIIDGSGLQAGFEAPGTKNADIIIGGRNLYRKTSPFSVLVAGSQLAARLATGFQLLGINANTGSMRLAGVIPSNGTYTLSFDLSVGSANGYPLEIDVCDGFGGGSWTIDPTTLVQHFEKTFTVTGITDSNVYNFIDFSRLSGQHYFFTNFKVENGNKATAWTSAPEDVTADAQAKADAAQAAAQAAAATDATAKANAAQAAATAAAAADATAKANAAQAAAQAAANAGLADKLSKSGNEEISGQKSLTSQYALLVGTVNDGIIYGSTGLYGRKAGLTTFSIGADGTATFAGTMLAASGTFGAVSIAAGGSLGIGATGYNTNAGIWLGFVGANPKMSVRTANGSTFLCDPANNVLEFNGAKVTNMVVGNPLTLNTFPASDWTVTHNVTTSLGTLTATATGGTGTIKYAWSMVGGNTGTTIVSFTSALNGATVSLSVKAGNIGINTGGTIRCTATDASGLSTATDLVFSIEVV